MTTTISFFDDIIISDRDMNETTKALIRDIKCKIVLLEDKIPLHINRFNCKDNRRVYKETIEKLSKLDGIYCGSFSLFVHGLIDRPPKDIDILADRNSEKIKKFLSKNKEKIDSFNLESSFKNVVEGFDPIRQFKINDILIDMFHDTNVKYIEHIGLKIQCPFQVILKKIDIYSSVYREKDLTDLKLINKRLDVILDSQV